MKTKSLALAMVLASLVSQTARAQEFTLNVEPAGAVWLDKPQSDRFNSGYSVAIRAGVTLGRAATLQASYVLLQTPAKGEFTSNGSAHMLSGGLRLRPLTPLRPDSDDLAGLFIDGNVSEVRTGSLDRFGFDAGLGYDFQVAETFAIGPVVRYGHIVQPNGIDGQNPDDAQYMTAGLDLAFGFPHRDDVEEPYHESVAPECPPEVECAECPDCVAEVCPDRDGDTVCDDHDRCDTSAGPAASFGCPLDPCTGEPLVVLVQFEFDSATMPERVKGRVQTMDPVLDAVAEAIAQDPTCRVCIIGNASEEGSDSRNQELSVERAGAVQAYLMARGLTANRMPTTGLGAECQIVPEASREMNRRVEFRRLGDDESCPTDCSL